MPLYIRVPFFSRKLLDDPAVQAQSADCVPGEFPQPLSRPPDAARALDCRARFALFPIDPNADEVVVVAARFARATRPRDVLNDQLCGLDASPGRSVVSDSGRRPAARHNERAASLCPPYRDAASA